jgi:hypothetical protein
VLETIGIIFIILVVMQVIDKGIEEVEEQEKLKAQQQAMREDLLLLTRELVQELNKDNKE